MTFDSTRLTVFHTCVTGIGVPESKVSSHFTFKLRPCSETCTELPQKDPEHYEVIDLPIYILLVPQTSKFQSVSLYDQLLNQLHAV